jgi:sporadic carbohydrate cluster protein (TIGR04323 family)
MISNRKGYRGYICARQGGGRSVPQHVQQMVIRDYCTRNNMHFLLSVVEYQMPGCTMILDAVLDEELNHVEGIVMYSQFLLPSRKEDRMRLYQKVLEKGCTLHMAAEGIKVAANEDIQRLEDTCLVQEVISDQSPDILNYLSNGGHGGQEINFLEAYQKKTQRNYIERVTSHDKAECAAIAKQWGPDYWDGARQHGYGGYKYDGRWAPIAQDIAKHYGLKAGDKILDIGCGKAFLLHEFMQAVPGVEVAGLDISEYGVANAKEEVRPYLKVGNCTQLPWPDGHFDFVYSILTFHNLQVQDMKKAVQEMQRVGKGKKWFCTESYRNEREKVNLLYWQLTCESFYRPEAWKFLLDEWGYDGDYGFIYFE